MRLKFYFLILIQKFNSAAIFFLFSHDIKDFFIDFHQKPLRIFSHTFAFNMIRNGKFILNIKSIKNSLQSYKTNALKPFIALPYTLPYFSTVSTLFKFSVTSNDSSLFESFVAVFDKFG